MEVLDGLAYPLLVVGGGDDLQILLQAQAALAGLAARRLYDQFEVVDSAFQAAGDDDLVLPAFAVVRKYVADGAVAPAVTADRFQRWRDILNLVVDAEALGHFAAANGALRRGIPFRQHQPEYSVRTHGPDSER